MKTRSWPSMRPRRRAVACTVSTCTGLYARCWPQLLVHWSKARQLRSFGRAGVRAFSFRVLSGCPPLQFAARLLLQRLAAPAGANAPPQRPARRGLFAAAPARRRPPAACLWHAANALAAVAHPAATTRLPPPPPPPPLLPRALLPTSCDAAAAMEVPQRELFIGGRWVPASQRLPVISPLVRLRGGAVSVVGVPVAFFQH